MKVILQADVGYNDSDIEYKIQDFFSSMNEELTNGGYRKIEVKEELKAYDVKEIEVYTNDNDLMLFLNIDRPEDNVFREDCGVEWFELIQFNSLDELKNFLRDDNDFSSEDELIEFMMGLGNKIGG